MSRQYLLLAGITIVLVPIGVYAYAWSQQDDTSPLESYLGSNGFVPITPPSTFVTLGSLYYLDGESHLLNEICGVGSEDIDKEKLNAWIQHSPGETGSGINISGSKFVIQLDLGASGVGAQEQNSTRRQISYTLTDVSFDKISMEHDRAVADVLMKKDNCRSSVTRVWEAGGYVCQGRLIVTASAKYDLSSAETMNIGGKVKEAIEAKDHTILNLDNDGTWKGQSLEYGVAMDPLCIAPEKAIFQRILPRNALQRAINYLKFQVLEPLLG